jgi:release factor glutamine methyltransferase
MTAMTVECQTQEELKTVELRTNRDAIRQGRRFLLAAGVESASLDAEVLLADVLGMRKTELYLKIETALKVEDERRFWKRLQRRAQREPVAYITGRKEFWSLDFVVTPDVLIPRPETELLVEITLDYLKAITTNTPSNILDLGTGSGAIAVSLAKERLEANIWAVDVSLSALEIARVNGNRHAEAGRIKFVQGDLFEPVRAQRSGFDLIVSNPPYIRTGELSTLAPDIRDWEPRRALDGGVDGMDYYRRIVGEAHHFLAPAGAIVLEISPELSQAVVDLFTRCGCYERASVYADLAGKDRVIAAIRATESAPKGARRG